MSQEVDYFLEADIEVGCRHCTMHGTLIYVNVFIRDFVAGLLITGFLGDAMRTRLNIDRRHL